MTIPGKRFPTYILALTLMAAVGAACVAIRLLTAAPPAAAQNSSIPIVDGYAQTSDVPIWLSGLGAVQPLQSVNVKVRVDGQLDKVMFYEGQDVRAGTVLAQIDSRPFEAQLKQAQAQRARDEAQLSNARIDLERYTTLSQQDSIAQQQVDTQRAAVEQLNAAVDADQSAVAMAQLQVQFTTITSPLDGRVGLRLVDPGSIVHVSDATGLATVTQMEPIAAIFTVPQDALPDVRNNMAKGVLPVVAFSRDGASELAHGKLVFVDSQVDPATGQVRLKALFENKGRTLWPGQFISARILLRTEKNAVTIPAKAIQNGPAGTYVYAIKQDKTVVMQPVTVSTINAGSAIILSGLDAGAHIVVEGQYRLEPGSTTEVTPAQRPRP
ncbi:MAG: efflux transporter periplasmic adaptor subunit [Herminiimonas sp.]|nr:efflux transporter periplasmic adaptor subunit [Herminiimonas sp.]